MSPSSLKSHCVAELHGIEQFLGKLVFESVVRKSLMLLVVKVVFQDLRPVVSISNTVPIKQMLLALTTRHGQFPLSNNGSQQTA
eukprot:1590607-Ditylum_brightwellii.AAC.2